MHSLDSLVVPADSGEHVRFGRSLGTRRIVDASATNGTLAVVEHDLPPHQLGAPIHTHVNEDEYSYVLSGRLGAQVGDDVLEAGPGDTVMKPRRIPHAFWNAGDEPVRFLELISPGAFGEYFFELAEPLNAGDQAGMGAVMARYQLEMRLDSVDGLVERHGLEPLPL